MGKDIYQIASDYFCGRISEADREYLNAWLNQSPDNQDVFAELERVWNLTGSLQSNIDADLDLEWSHFLENRQEANTESKLILPKPSLWANPLFKVAAVLIPAILIVGSILFFFLGNGGNQEWVTVRANDSKIEQTLPDGSVVWINENSTLSYPKKFTGKQRKVKLSGEGFFSVVKHKGTFTIEAGTSEIQVLGTQFNVRNYTGEPSTEVMVKEGKVSFASLTNKNSNITLVAGEKGTLNIQTNEIEKETISNTNTLGWLTHQLTFANTPLSQVKKDIERYFRKAVVVTSSTANVSFTGTFTNPQLEEVLHTLSLTINCNYKLKNDTVFIGN